MESQQRKNERYRLIPRVDRILSSPPVRELEERYGHGSVKEAVREVLEQLRKELETDGGDPSVLCAEKRVIRKVEAKVETAYCLHMKPVINATGTILHTGLGRAPIGEAALEQAVRIGSGYSNLEYDLETGSRGNRSSHFERLLCALTGAEAAIAVNNNAGAVLLVLSALAAGGEVIVSRGELVEIGGAFRIPDVMELSGARLREAGTTNRTRLSDYEAAVGEETKLLLKVHTSNYRIVGFSESVSVGELSGLGKRTGIPVAEDLGSGVLFPLVLPGMDGEPTVREVIGQGADIVCFSGDKLLGGPQAGIIAGKKEYVDRIRKHPLARALRMDKFTASALEAVLLEYTNPERARRRIPVLRMLTEPVEETEKRAKRLLELLLERGCGRMAALGVEASLAQAGGGALPGEEIESRAVWICPEKQTAAVLEKRLRTGEIPVVARVQKECVLIDLRTVSEEEIVRLADAVWKALEEKE